MKFLWRLESGKILSLSGESANSSLMNYGTVLSWDGDLNTVDVKKPSGKVEKLTFTGAR